jgi:hypothetical protein
MDLSFPTFLFFFFGAFSSSGAYRDLFRRGKKHFFFNSS